MTAAHSAAPLPLRPRIPPAAPLRLAEALAHTPADQSSGTLRVTGKPGGVFYLAHDTVIAVESPGAPDVPTLLLRSGRIAEADWATAFEAGAADGRVGAELIARTLIGAVELQVICQMAALDGAFAIAAGRIDDCVLQDGPAAHWLPAPRGIEREWLLSETERRLTALFASHRALISPYRDRVFPTRQATGQSAVPLTDERREILRCVNGRRSSRDIAFLLGRSVYAVTVEISRMLGEGLIELPSRRADLGCRPRSAGGLPQETTSPDAPDGGLPRRARGASGINDILPLRPATERP